jgi:hypothetical protein
MENGIPQEQTQLHLITEIGAPPPNIRLSALHFGSRDLGVLDTSIRTQYAAANKECQLIQALNNPNMREDLVSQGYPSQTSSLQKYDQRRFNV